MQKSNGPTRVRQINQAEPSSGSCVVYIMSREQRVSDNIALYESQQYALRAKVPLIVVFHLYTSLGYRIMPQYDFMITGLKEVENRLRELSIPFLVYTGTHDVYTRLFHDLKPAALFMDFSPLRGPISLRKTIAREAPVPCFEVDSHNIVPAWVTSNKEEWAAYTIRPKIRKLLPDYLHEPPQVTTHPFPATYPVIDWNALKKLVRAPLQDGYNPPFISGEQEALHRAQAFIHKGLQGYATDRNDPTKQGQSDLSPYFHFGQLSSLRVAYEVTEYVRKNPEAKMGADAYLEELIIRKELSDNFCYYNAHYDSYQGLRPWAKKTLEAHRTDTRERIYTRDEFEAGKTYDPAWNAAQHQLTKTGKMHGYMRMYWAKKILEWTPDAETAISYAVYLNDMYHLDGYDPNGYAGILWSIGGVHDRPWFNRPVFGSIRYMALRGLQKKFNLDEYIRKWTITP